MTLITHFLYACLHKSSPYRGAPVRVMCVCVGGGGGRVVVMVLYVGDDIIYTWICACICVCVYICKIYLRLCISPCAA